MHPSYCINGDPGPFLDPVLSFAGHRTGVAADTPVKVDNHPVSLSHTYPLFLFNGYVLTAFNLHQYIIVWNIGQPIHILNLIDRIMGQMIMRALFKFL